MVSECKIKQLQTENEALRNHLKLALDSLKNPIPPVTLEKRSTSLSTVSENDSCVSSRGKENRPGSPTSDVETEPDLVWEDDEDTIRVNDDQLEAHNMQSHMEDLLMDLSLFKRKLASDHERFRAVQVRPCRKRRRALGDIWTNNR